MKPDVSNFVIFGIAAMLVLAIGIILFTLMYQRRMLLHHLEIKAINEKKQHELIQAMVHGEEVERQRIASELHDDIGAELSTVKTFFYKAVQHPEDPSLVIQGKELLDQSIKKIRDISHKLQPSMLHRLGLLVALRSFCEIKNKAGAIKVEFIANGDIPRLRENAELSAYRIVQELFNNLEKHSMATELTLTCQTISNQLNILITHNGNGLTNKQYEQLTYKEGAIGLKNIVNRLQVMNGTINFELRPDHLYEIRLSTEIV
jgi:two-component system, NarL family, sensor kinase